MTFKVSNHQIGPSILVHCLRYAYLTFFFIICLLGVIMHAFLVCTFIIFLFSVPLNICHTLAKGPKTKRYYLFSRKSSALWQKFNFILLTKWYIIYKNNQKNLELTYICYKVIFSKIVTHWHLVSWSNSREPCFFGRNLVIHVGFQKVRYLWIPSKKWHRLGSINRSVGLHLCILGQKTQTSVCDIRL